jgi:hypothetical protein
MPFVVAPIPGAFAREVVGVDCSASLTDEDISGIDAAMIGTPSSSFAASR